MTKRFMKVLPLLVTAVAIGCGDDDSTGPGDAGSYEITITGDVNETADGPAWFGADTNDEGDPVFAIAFGDDESRHFIVTGKFGSERPGVGTYEISAEEWDLVHTISDDDELLGLFIASEGQINITQSTATRLVGTIDFVAEGFANDEVAAIEGSIEFSAARAPGSGLAAARAAR